MEKIFKKILKGYQVFKKKYAYGNRSVMKHLAMNGQNPEIMVVACCDSRADPALLLQCAPGELFVVRNVANLVPPYEKDATHHGTSAALEFGICHLKVKHLILLGHSQCGGIMALLNHTNLHPNDFITDWVSIINIPSCLGEENFSEKDLEDCAKLALHKSYKNCLTFPWINSRVADQFLKIHLWFLDIKTGQVFTYNQDLQEYHSLDPIKT